MADVIRYVDPDASGAGTGLDWTNAYTSLSAWQAVEVTDLVAASDTHTVYCRSSSGTMDTTSVTINGWTTSAACSLTIECQAADYHGGVQDAGYVLYRSVTWADGIDVQDDYVTLRRIAVKGCRDGIISRSAYTTIDKCYVYDSASHGLRIRTASIDGIIKNSKFVNCDIGIGCVDFLQSAEVLNCTIGNCGTSGLVSTNSTLIAKNCYADAPTCYSGFTLTTCASSDATGSAGLQTVAYSASSGAYFTNVTSGSEDFKLSSSSSDLYEAGTDLSGDGVTEDMFGTSRSDPYDIGLHELSAGTIIPGVIHHRQQQKAS